ncbi:MAG TPA: DUF3089 domain-containing protein [Solirubrobacteraceae bacterium]|nr:DUF3089 domain-containing protein [Solirubrobacteraceae bacterium]
MLATARSMGSLAAGRVRCRGIALLCATALFALGGGAGSAAAAVEGTPEAVWLCKPGLAHNPCLASEETTVELADGSSFVTNPRPAGNPPIDCFYVYPTVSSQGAENASLEIDPEEEAIAEAQASRFSQDCKLYAPIYPQLTLQAINNPGGISPEGAIKAYLGVRAAFLEYLERYNHGRGFVLIGHSQGAAMLIQLIRELIDPNPALRAQMVSSILLGGNVIVPEGRNVGGSFKNVPACRAIWQTGCVIAYSSFLHEPPNPSFFGRPQSPLLGLGTGTEGVEHPQVLCVNPTLFFQSGSEGPLLPDYPTRPFPGLLGIVTQTPKAPTPWVSYPGQYDARCRNENGASWLQLSYVGAPGDVREQLRETLGPQWGTHLVDVNVALGNLVLDVRLQSFVYSLRQRFFL